MCFCHNEGDMVPDRPFAGRFFAYYEDIDWCWRAQLAGRRVVYNPAATVEHRHSASSGGQHRPWVRVMSERNRTLTMVRNGPRPLVAKALRDRTRNGPDGGVRAGIARLLPWALATRGQMERHWDVGPGRGVGALGRRRRGRTRVPLTHSAHGRRVKDPATLEGSRPLRGRDPTEPRYRGPPPVGPTGHVHCRQQRHGHWKRRGWRTS